MARISGTLQVNLLSNGTVVEAFMPDSTSGTSKPLLAKNVAAAEQDFRDTFGLTNEDAAAKAAELTRKGDLNFQCFVEEAILTQLCVIRGAGV